MENKNFNGFKSQEQLDEITEIITNVMEDVPSITEICGYSVHLDSVDSIDITFTVNNEKYWYTIELWADHNVEVQTNANRIWWDIVDLIATLREKLMDGDFDEYFLEYSN